MDQAGLREPIQRSPMPDRALHNVVYAEIVDAVHRGDMKPGDRITEWEIAQRLGISRSPVREAFARLASDHLIVRQPRRGNFIAQLDVADIEHIRVARQLLEGHAAREAAVRFTPDDRLRLEEIVDEMVEAANRKEWIQTVSLNARFHAVMIEIAGNPIIGRMWSAVDPLTWLAAAASTPGARHDPDDQRRRHQYLIDALESGDSDLAEEAFRYHVAESVRSQPALSTDGIEPVHSALSGGIHAEE